VASISALPASSTGEPPKRLIGWAKVTLQPQSLTRVELTFDPETIAEQHQLSYWDTGTESWVTGAGRYTVSVGTSSGNLKLHDSFKLK